MKEREMKVIWGVICDGFNYMHLNLVKVGNGVKGFRWVQRQDL